MQNSPALEVYARDIIRQRLHEAEQDALAAQLPRRHPRRPAARARRHLADGLRALAIRLDPSVLRERGVASAPSGM